MPETVVQVQMTRWGQSDISDGSAYLDALHQLSLKLVCFLAVVFLAVVEPSSNSSHDYLPRDL